MRVYVYTCRRCLARINSQVERAGAIYCRKCQRFEALATLPPAPITLDFDAGTVTKSEAEA